MTLHVKMAMPDLQLYSWNLSLINNVEDNAVFWCVYYVSLRSQKFPSHFLQRNKKQKMSRLQTQKHRVLIHICLDKACKSGRHCYFWMYFEFIFECLYTQEFFSHAWVEKLNISWLFLSNPIFYINVWSDFETKLRKNINFPTLKLFDSLV